MWKQGVRQEYREFYFHFRSFLCPKCLLSEKHSEKWKRREHEIFFSKRSKHGKRMILHLVFFPLKITCTYKHTNGYFYEKITQSWAICLHCAPFQLSLYNHSIQNALSFWQLYQFNWYFYRNKSKAEITIDAIEIITELNYYWHLCRMEKGKENNKIIIDFVNYSHSKKI